MLHDDVSLITETFTHGKKPAPKNPAAITGEEINAIKNSMCQGIDNGGGISSASAMLNYYRGWVDNETWCPAARANEYDHQHWLIYAS